MSHPADPVVRLGQRRATATRHPFLDGVRDGTLPVAALDTWLVQDALFVADLLAFQARLLARAPRPAQAVLAGGAVALVEELDWFEGLAADRGLDLSASPRRATREYALLLQRLDAAPYPDAVGCLWVLEQVHLDAWASASPGAQRYAELVEHWTTPGFAACVAALQALSEQAGPPDEDLVGQVLDQEAAFWQMALEAAAP
jgi:thiaminase